MTDKETKLRSPVAMKLASLNDLLRLVISSVGPDRTSGYIGYYIDGDRSIYFIFNTSLGYYDLNALPIMIWVDDPSGILLKRPHYIPEELDRLCEDAVVAFLMDKYGEPKFPISTGDLEQFLEFESSDFDPFADLSSEGNDIEGITVFLSGRNEIPRNLSQPQGGP